MPLNDYIELGYIESSGTQYINTGWSKPNSDEGPIIHMDFEFIGSSSSLQGLFGCNHNSTYQLRQYIGATSDYKWYLRWRNNEYTSETTWNLNTRYNLEAKLRRSDRYIKIDDSYVIQSGGEASNYWSLPMYLFAINNNGTAENFSKIRLYRASLYQDSTLVRDYIPAKRKSDDAIGLYDQENDVFYPNSGTGEFTAGPEIIIETIFEYSISVQTYIVPKDGWYKLEVWGSQGGKSTMWSSPVSASFDGGKGGYSIGYKYLYAGTTLYVLTGGNGLSRGGTYQSGNITCRGGDGGSATSIATITGTLQQIGYNNIDKIIIVAGGGGGGSGSIDNNYPQGLNGGAGGGVSGGAGYGNGGIGPITPGEQTIGYAFGQGQDGWGNGNVGGGGGGLFGGRSATNNSVKYFATGAGGSGYVGNLDGGMTYQGVNEGNGYAKITLLAKKPTLENCLLKVNGRWSNAILYTKKDGQWISGGLKVKENNVWR